MSQSIKKLGATGITKVGFRMVSNFLDLFEDVIVISSTSKEKFYNEFKQNYNLKHKPKNWYTLKYRFASSIGKKEKKYLVVAKYFLNIFRYNLKKFIFKSDSILICNHITEDIFEIKSNNKSLKTVVIIHGSPDAYLPENNALYSQEYVADILNAFDYVVYLSNANLKSWTQKLVSNPNYFIIGNAIEEDEVNLILNRNKETYYDKLKFNRENFNVVVPGTVTYRKGQDLILRNLSKIVNFIPNIHIHFIGSIRDQWANDLVNDISKSTYSTYITFHGFVNNSLEFIYASDLVLLPSRAEGQPLGVLEAMALGKVVVTTNYEGIEEVIDNEISGFIIDMNNFDDLITDVLVKIYSDNEKKQLVEINSKNKYIENFSILKQKEKIKNLINEISRR